MKIFLFILIAMSVQGQIPDYDILIRNGIAVDGTGKKGFKSDVGIRGDRIIALGDLSKKTASRIIDAKGFVVAPGFIDMLGQSEFNILINSSAESKITQGITTELTCEGESVAPWTEEMRQEYQKDYNYYGLQVDWKAFPEYFARFEKQGSAINMGFFVGATTVRQYVIGNADRRATPEELEKMKDLVRESMQQGVMGLSSSLQYTPALFAGTDELIELAKAASASGGIYITHIRSEGNNIEEALDEAIRIGQEASIPVEIYHLKVSGKQNWQKMSRVLKRIEEVRKQGVRILADQYPYTAAMTGLTACLPAWIREGGSRKMFERLRDTQNREEAKRFILKERISWDNMYVSADGGKGILVASVQNKDLKKYEGKTVSDIASDWGKDELDTIMDFVLADSGRTGCVYFVMSEENVKMILSQPWVSVDCDASAKSTSGILSQEKTHPRAWGTFPRILGKYVREENVLSLEQAIHKFTGLPAEWMNLGMRGLLKEGYFADVTIFDPRTIRDRSTYENPHQRSEGIQYVLVNGKMVVDQGEISSERPGRVLKRAGSNGK